MLQEIYLFFWNLFFQGVTDSFLVAVSPVLCSLISFSFLLLAVFSVAWSVYRVIRFILSLAGGGE